MAIKKQFLRNKPICKVTFKLSKETANSAEQVQLLGDFNNWDTGSTPMRRSRKGEFTETVKLEVGKEYQYKFLINGKKWENDFYADKLITNSQCGTNSVLIL